MRSKIKEHLVIICPSLYNFRNKISTKQDIASTEISYQFLAPKDLVLRRNKATNSLSLNDLFSAAIKPLY